MGGSLFNTAEVSLTVDIQDVPLLTVPLNSLPRMPDRINVNKSTTAPFLLHSSI